MRNRSRTPPAVPEMLDLSGRKVADYHLLRMLGQGGMGQVYLAEQIALKRKVALKVLRPDLAANATALARFKQEAEAVAQATHANIVQVYDYGEDGGVWYMALEYVEGRNLKDFINKKGPPELQIALSIMRQVASALQRASELGIIHRDIKPENILLTRKGEVKVADFGLSRTLTDEERPKLNLTQTGVTMGTPLYMSPEQVEGKEVDPRTDIYSFGVTCYHMLSGRPPFRGDTAFEVALAHVQTEPEPLKNVRPDLPEGLCAIVHKMMAKSPEQRYQTARELSRDIIRLREGLNGVPSANSMPSIQVDPGLLNTIIPPDASVIPSGKGSATAITAPPPPLPPSSPKGRWGLLAGAVALSLLIAVTGGAAWGWRERATEGPLPYGDDSIRTADAQVSDRVQRPSVREQKLVEKVKPYLDHSKGQDPRPVLGECLELGLFYLDNGRLDDATALFQRLEKFNTPREIKGSGQIGRAVVLAMQHKPKESNVLLKDVFTMFNPKKSPPKGKFGPLEIPGAMGITAAKRADDMLKPVNSVLSHSRWQYYLARARYLNEKNGLREEDMPPLFLMKAQVAQLPRRN